MLMRFLPIATLFILTFFSDFTNAQIKVDTLLSDAISIRAIAVDGNQVWYAADKGRYGRIDLAKRTRDKRKIFIDTMQIEFRSLAQTPAHVFIFKIGNPALLYKISKTTLDEQLVYSEKNSGVFYDAMQFWNDREGIAIGDPTDGCLSMIVTRDGGHTWQKIGCDVLPATIEGEAAFAASNTNIAIQGDHTWVVSGGKKARVFYSPDKGRTWTATDTPMVQGGSMTGIFTVDFYDRQTGVIAGGDYENPQNNSANKAITHDGGKTWKLIGENSGFGYASCIRFVPQSGGVKLLCVGATGIHLSSDGGGTWRKLSDDKDLYTIWFIDPVTAIAAGKNKLVRLTLP